MGNIQLLMWNSSSVHFPMMADSRRVAARSAAAVSRRPSPLLRPHTGQSNRLGCVHFCSAKRKRSAGPQLDCTASYLCRLSWPELLRTSANSNQDAGRRRGARKAGRLGWLRLPPVTRSAQPRNPGRPPTLRGHEVARHDYGADEPVGATVRLHWPVPRRRVLVALRPPPPYACSLRGLAHLVHRQPVSLLPVLHPTDSEDEAGGRCHVSVYGGRRVALVPGAGSLTYIVMARIPASLARP